MLAALVLVSCGRPLDDTQTTAVHQDALDAVTSFGSNPGNLKMYRYVPANLPTGRPIVVLLHGCTQTAADFSASWPSWLALADQRQFAVVFPEQQAGNNTNSCFNWFEPGDQGRDQGENLSIRQMVETTATALGSSHWYVAGFSAGAAQTINLLAAYPDLFSAGASCAGLPYKCAGNSTEAFLCMSGSSTQTPTVWASRGRSGFPGYSGSYPRLAIYQGLGDFTVAPINRTGLVAQWAALQSIDTTVDDTAAISSGGTRSNYRATTGGETLVQLNEIPAPWGHAIKDAWASDIVDFFGIVAPVVLVDAGTGGGSAAGGGSASLGGGSASLGGGSAGGSSSADAGTSTPAPLKDCSCSSGPGGLLLLAAWLRRRRR